MSGDIWLNKQNVVYTYNGILFSLKKEWNFDTCHNMDGPQRSYARWNKSVTREKILYGSTYMRYLE